MVGVFAQHNVGITGQDFGDHDPSGLVVGVILQFRVDEHCDSLVGKATDAGKPGPVTGQCILKGCLKCWGQSVGLLKADELLDTIHLRCDFSYTVLNPGELGKSSAQSGKLILQACSFLHLVFDCLACLLYLAVDHLASLLDPVSEVSVGANAQSS